MHSSGKIWTILWGQYYCPVDTHEHISAGQSHQLMILHGTLLNFHVGAFDIGIVKQYICDLAFDFREKINKFDIGWEQQLSRRRGAEVEFVVQQLKLHGRTARRKRGVNCSYLVAISSKDSMRKTRSILLSSSLLFIELSRLQNP